MAELTNADLPVGLEMETFSPVRRLLRAAVVNPLANYAPAGMLRALLRWGKSELAAANWKDPGGWESMVISYDGNCRQVADRLLVNGGAMSAALRNRKRLGSYLLARLIEQAGGTPVTVLCLGAGPGAIILEALAQASVAAQAILVDISPAAFEYGRKLAESRNLADRVRFIQADVRDLDKYLHEPPHVVKMLGICEYLSDEQNLTIVRAAVERMPVGGALVFNSLSLAHGNDRFFRRVFGLRMIHRSPEQLCDLMARAGLGSFVVHREPLGVYHVVVARKAAAGASATGAPHAGPTG